MNLLEELYQALLNESADMNTPNSIIKSIERGLVPGVKFKEFFKGPYLKNIERTESAFKRLLEKIVPVVSKDNFNRFIFLLLKKAGHIDALFTIDYPILIDSFKAYFNNINKKEVLTDEVVKKEFRKFASSPLNYDEMKKFEQWANEKFAQKAKMKEGEAETIYDKDGWKAVVPHTFAAAKQYACMNNKKAKWCTAANADYFNHYTAKGTNKLYIIFNKGKNVMFQMDFGTFGNPNFKKENDMPASFVSVRKAGVPDDLLSTIKDKDGKSVYDYIKEFKDEEKAEKKQVELNTSNKRIKKEMESWKIKKYKSLDEWKANIDEETNDSLVSVSVSALGWGKINKVRTTIEDALKRTKDEGYVAMGKIYKGGTSYYYIIPSKGNVSYEDITMDSRVVKQKLVVRVTLGKPRLLNTKEMVSAEIPNFLKNILLDESLRKTLSKDELLTRETPQEKKLSQGGIIKNITSLNQILNSSFLNDSVLFGVKKILSEINIKDIASIVVTKGDTIVYIIMKNGKVIPSSKYTLEPVEKEGIYIFDKEIRAELFNEFKKYNLYNINALDEKVIRKVFMGEPTSIEEIDKEQLLFNPYDSNVITSKPVHTPLKEKFLFINPKNNTHKAVSVKEYMRDPTAKNSEQLYNLYKAYYKVISFGDTK